MASIQHVCLWRIGEIAYTRMPQGIPVSCIKRYKVAASISGKDKTTRGRQQSTATAAVELMPPCDLAGFRIYRSEDSPRAIRG